MREKMPLLIHLHQRIYICYLCQNCRQTTESEKKQLKKKERWEITLPVDLPRTHYFTAG